MMSDPTVVLAPVCPDDATTNSSDATPDTVDTRAESSSPWWKVRRVAENGDLSQKVVYAAIRRGELRHTRIGLGRNIRVHQGWATQWMRQRAAGGDR